MATEIMTDVLSGVNLSDFSIELKNNFVDCFIQSFGADPFAEHMELMVKELAEHVIPGTMRRSGSRVEETITPIDVGDQSNQQADNDFMHVIDRSCINDTFYTEDTGNPGFVRIMVSSREGIHSIIRESLDFKDGAYMICSMKIKHHIKLGIGIVQEHAERCKIEYLFSNKYTIKSLIIGPSIRLICTPLQFQYLPSMVSYDHGEPLDNVDDNIKNAEIDFVPSFLQDGWPPQASNWLTRGRKWPNDDLVNKISTLGYHLVPKPSSKETEEFEWRISFSQAEGLLFQSIPRYSLCKQCYRIFKCMIKYHLSLPSVISSYHCKTLFLWTVERFPPETWTDRNLGHRYLLLLDELLHAVIQRTLPQYFIPKDNLFKNLNNDFANTVAKILSGMRRSPLKFIYRANRLPWDEKFQGMSIEEMLYWDEKPENERYVFTTDNTTNDADDDKCEKEGKGSSNECLLTSLKDFKDNDDDEMHVCSGRTEILYSRK